MTGRSTVHKTLIGGMKGLVVENDSIRAAIVQDYGARIVSLIYKPSETDFAWHNPNIPLRKPSFGVELEDVSGFFDCTPTTEACTFKGRKLPAGGDVGFEPWKLLKIHKTQNSVGVTLERTCKNYPMKLRKHFSLQKNESILRLHYTLTNLSNENLEYHYSTHNTMAVTPYHRFILPGEVEKFRLGYAITDRLGKLGDDVSWPETTDKNGKPIDLRKMGNPTDGEGENLYTSKLKETWAAALNEARGELIAFSWTTKVLPYLLFWRNDGGWRGYYHAALEPLSGRPDNLEMAVKDWKEYATLRPKGSVEWDENIILAHGVKGLEKVEGEEPILS